MKLKAKKTIAGVYGIVTGGDEFEAKDALAKELIEKGLVEVVEGSEEATEPVKEKVEVNLSTPTVKLKGKEKKYNAGPGK